MCVMRAPEIFEQSEIDGLARVKVQDLSEAQTGPLREAIASCPVGAISMAPEKPE